MNTLLTSAERAKLTVQCSNMLNWSDGGHWQGAGPAPNCHVKERATSTSSHTYNFPTDESASRWNSDCEAAIRQVGHLATGALTVGTTMATSGFGGIAVASLLAITKDEIQARIPYPRMERGWSYKVQFTYEFRYSPIPGFPKGLVQTIETESRNHVREIVDQTHRVLKYHLDQLPDGLARLLATKPASHTESDY
ncbi:hypothetical protein [Halioxenophilus aromaticivorans]|uniref:Uncharacterized protein n=1 Tax=Halioxenophilus aromaticivorans TaxID=1306992 RepID=A0AAV3U162_9ALTE